MTELNHLMAIFLLCLMVPLFTIMGLSLFHDLKIFARGGVMDWQVPGIIKAPVVVFTFIGYGMLYLFWMLFLCLAWFVVKPKTHEALASKFEDHINDH